MLRKYFQVLPGEYQKVFLMQFSIFLIITSLLILKSTFSSIFLTDHGVELLPWVYILIAITAILVNHGINKISDARPLIQVVQATHFLNIILLGGIYFAVSKGLIHGWMSIAVLVFVSIYALITTSQFWQLITSMMNMRDTKRFIGLIGAGAIGGGIFGGYLTSSIVEYVGNAGLVLIVLGILVINWFVSVYLYRNHRSSDLNVEENNAKDSGEKYSIWKLLSKTHIRNVAIVIGLGVLISRLVDFQFNYIILQTPRSSEDLTSFLGFWFSTINVLGFIIQLFLTSKIVSRLGMEKSMYILPGGTLIMVFFNFLFPGLATAILLKSNDGALKQSIYKASYELSLMPIHNTIRSKVKYFVDLVVDSVATGLGGIILLLCLIQGQVSLTILVLINAILTIGWLFWIKKTGNSYHQTFIQNMKKVKSNVDLPSRSMLLAAHHSGQPRKPLSDLLDRSVRKKLNQFSLSEESVVSIVAHKFALEMGINYRKLSQKYDRSDVTGQLNILQAVASFLPDNKKLARDFGFAAKLNAFIRLQEDPHSLLQDKVLYRLSKIIVISRSYKNYPVVINQLNSELSVQSKLLAIQVCRLGTARSFAKHLLPLISEPLLSEKVMDCLASYGKGYVNFISNRFVMNEALPEESILVLSKIESQASIDLLFKLLDSSKKKVRNAALSSLNFIRENNPDLVYKRIIIRKKIKEEVKLLKNLVWAQFQLQQISITQDSVSREQVVDLHSIMNTVRVLSDKSKLRMFILLGLTFNKQNVNHVYRALVSKKASIRQLALDFLDEYLSYDLKSSLVPVLSIQLTNDIDDQEVLKLGVKTKNARINTVFNKLYAQNDKSLQRKLLGYARKWESKRLKAFIQKKSSIQVATTAARQAS